MLREPLTRAASKSPAPEGGSRSEEESIRLRSRLAAYGQIYALPLIWLLVVLIFGILRPNTFLTAANFQTIFGSQATLAVVTLALLVPLTAGDYDLSVAATLALSTNLVGILNVNQHIAVVPAIAIALSAGLLIGVCNGAIVVLLGMDPFIATLGTGTVVTGVVYWIGNSATISGISNGLVNAVSVDTFLGVPLGFYYGLALCVILWYVLEFTPMGRRLLYVGRGRNVSRLSGLRVGRIRWGALAISGLLSALAGVIYAGTTGAADPTSGQSFLLPAFAAAFLGSTTIRPGRFNPWGALVAVYFLVTGITGLQLLGVQSFIQQLFYGTALVVAVGLSQYSRRREVKESGAL